MSLERIAVVLGVPVPAKPVKLRRTKPAPPSREQQSRGIDDTDVLPDKPPETARRRDTTTTKRKHEQRPAAHDDDSLFLLPPRDDDAQDWEPVAGDTFSDTIRNALRDEERGWY